MGKSKTVSTLLVGLVAVLIGASAWLVISYLNTTLAAVVTFASSFEATKLAAAGINVPPQFYQLRNDLPAILPLLYAGFPLLMIIIAGLSYAAGKNAEGNEEVEESQTSTRRSSSKAAQSGKTADDGSESDADGDGKSSADETEYTSTTRKTKR